MKTKTVTKVCGKCGKRKKPSDFPDDKKMWGGVSSWCNSCHAGEAPKVKAETTKEAK